MASAHNAKLPKEDFGRGLSIAEKFNVRAAARPNRRVKTVLKEAIGFLHGITGDIAKGAAVYSGSAWTGPDLVLDKKQGQETARSKERLAYMTGDVGLTLAAEDMRKLSDIRRTFKLSSDKQAAALSMRVYAQVADGIWRGNGFSLEKDGQQQPMNTDKIRSMVTQHAR
ncbi:MAG TPA: hypothetical protein PLW48_06380 [Alphaproteobacteria bacterium]|nr:hypothetical protein [Rhodospirillaceae bacterium]HRJ66747.1 hypothetical protein [Alphaproteobacteria bacterium]